MRKIYPNQKFLIAKLSLLGAGIIMLVVFTIAFFRQSDLTLIEFVLDKSMDIIDVSMTLFILYCLFWGLLIWPERVGTWNDSRRETTSKQSSRPSLLYKHHDDLQYELVIHNESAEKTFEVQGGKLNLLFGCDGGKFGTYEPLCGFDIEIRGLMNLLLERDDVCERGGEVEKLILEWLESDNENATYLADQICALFSSSFSAEDMENCTNLNK